MVKYSCAGRAETYPGEREALHTSELSDRSARSILASTLWADNYHNAIMLAAGELVAHGLGEYLYRGDYSPDNGKTIWRSPDGYWVDVDQYGGIDG